MVLTHAQIWTALDRLAALGGLSPSALAKKSGLDPTTFNKSKRITADGRTRWPSTESLAKALAATGTSIEAFAQLMQAAGASAIEKTVPLLGFVQAVKEGYFNSSGFPIGDGWKEIAFLQLEDEHAYALEISDRSMEPVYHDGTLILVSPAASVRPGDRVLIKLTDGKLMIKELKRRTAKTIELRSINSSHEHTLPVRDTLWIARILWASQ